MGHDTRDDDVLSPEEWEVREALESSGYSFDEYDFRNFTPGRVLHATYMRFIAAKTHRHLQDPPPDNLNPATFGAALRRVYDVADHRARRRYHGKYAWGYTGFRGPDSVQSRDEPGRPVGPRKTP